jgi:hypothetical protein|tara:strand:- start:5300 stop:5749 length:450 start_codon:yes stop_codon:yes gene_type:complete
MTIESQIYANLSILQGYDRQEFTYNEVIQCVFPYGKLKTLDWITEEFVSKYHINDDAIIGAESIPANSYLNPHTDIIRRSNLLINVGDNVAYVEHSNDGELVEVAIQPGESFLINTKVLHGCNNTTEHDFKFLTINTRQAYQRRIDEQV